MSPLSPDHITRLVTSALQGATSTPGLNIGCIIIVQGAIRGPLHVSTPNAGVASARER